MWGSHGLKMGYVDTEWGRGDNWSILKVPFGFRYLGPIFEALSAPRGVRVDYVSMGIKWANSTAPTLFLILVPHGKHIHSG